MIPYTRFLVPLFAAAFLSGCTSLPDYLRNGFKVGPNYVQPPTEVAPHWIDKPDVRVPSETDD